MWYYRFLKISYFTNTHIDIIYLQIFTSDQICVDASRYICSELVEGVDEVSDLVVDVGDQLLDLPLGVQRLDGLGVGVVADAERTGNSRRKVAANA